MIELTPDVVSILMSLHSFFQDEKKVVFWIKTKNLNFGNCAPIDLINRGRAHKVKQFIETALDEGKGPLC